MNTEHIHTLIQSLGWQTLVTALKRDVAILEAYMAEGKCTTLAEYQRLVDKRQAILDLIEYPVRMITPATPSQVHAPDLDPYM